MSTRGRSIDWAARRLTEGDVLDAFVAYCREVDDLDVNALSATAVEVSWRGRERSIVEISSQLRARAELTMVLGEITPAMVPAFLDDAGLRGRIAIYDLARLEKINAVRSSAFVHFEWFLSEEYGVKVIPADAFTRGLVERGIISLGFG